MGMIECRECKAHISDTANSCPKCGYTGRAGSITNPRNKIILALFMLVVVPVACIALLPATKNEKESQLSKTNISLDADKLLADLKKAINEKKAREARSNNYTLQHLYKGQPQAIEGDSLFKNYEAELNARLSEAGKAIEYETSVWRYSSSADEMTSKEIRYASVTSKNNFELSFPYQGRQSGELLIRQHPRMGQDAIVRIDKGQILCSRYDGCNLLVRFDEGKPQTFSALPPDNNDSTMLFFENHKRLIAGLRKAKQVRIQISLYQQPSQVLDFNVEGLKWP